MRIVFFKNLILNLNFNMITFQEYNLRSRTKAHLNNKHTLCSTSASYLVASHYYFVNVSIEI